MLKFMIVGVTIVLLFLGLMVFCINLATYLTRKMKAIRREREIQGQNRKKADQALTGKQVDEDIAVIAAAVAAFESERLTRA